MTSHPVTIVIPVYADWSSLKDCIDSLASTVDFTIHHVMLVNDCGPEADTLEANITKRIKNLSGFEYFRNPKNLGFVKTCNRAVNELDKTSNDILLLNSDTKATEGWLEEMLAVLHSAKAIGAVSPRSNNATICTLPLSAINVRGIAPAKSYKLFQKYRAKFPRHSRVPTAHGFCMLAKRELVKKYGFFDTAFGRGYGEEVDFCQRIDAHGYQSVLANRAFVFHLEAKSFSFETKSKLIDAHNKIIRSRYPGYQQSVADYIKKALVGEANILGGARKVSYVKARLKGQLRRSRLSSLVRR